MTSSIKLITFAGLLFGTVMLGSLLRIDTAAAASYCGSGYFSGSTGCTDLSYSDDVFSGRTSGSSPDAVPDWAANSKEGFIQYIENRLNGGARDHTGAAMVVNQMIGAGTGNGWAKDRTPSAAMMNEFRSRIRSGKVNMYRTSGDPNNYGNGRISFYSQAINDDFFTNYNPGGRRLIIFSVNGVVKYVVEKPCGNPVGGFGGGLPDNEFTLSPDSWLIDGGNRRDQIERRVGQTVTFNHQIKNNGPDGMGGQALNAYAEWYGGNSGRTGVTKNCDDGNGLPDGATTGNRCDDSFTIPNSAGAGTNFCQRVVGSPRSNSNGSAIGSANACVRVIPEWHLGNESSVVTMPIVTEYGYEALGGDPYGFRHKVRNDGPHGMGATDSYGLNGSRVWVEDRYNNEGWNTVSGTSRIMKRFENGVEQIDTSGTLRAGFKAGDTYCQRLRAEHRDGVGGSYSGSVTTAVACIDGRREFNLIPSTSLNPGSGAEAGSSVQVTPVVNNEGPSLSRDNTDWLLARFVLPPGTPVPGTSTGTGAPCLYYANGCQTMSQGKGTFQYGNPSTVTGQSGNPYGPSTFNIPDPSAIGTKYCFALSVKPYTHTSSTDWRYGKPSCVTIGIKPKLSVWGYDAKVGSTINTSVSRISGRTYGSWGEYGVLSNGANAGMASGSGLVDGNGAANQENWSALTFANSTVGGLPQFGNYGGVTTFTANQSGAFVINGDTNLPSGGYTSPFGAGFKRVVRINGTLTITGNMVYANGPYSSISQIPRVVIIANDIVINPGVTRIDPWLVANRIATCSAANDAGNYFVPSDRVSLSNAVCQNSLHFNGPVVANELYPYRTTDTGDNTDTAAEVFNLRADVFLSSFAGGGIDTPVASTDLVTDVPPRF